MIRERKNTAKKKLQHGLKKIFDGYCLRPKDPPNMAPEAAAKFTHTNWQKVTLDSPPMSLADPVSNARSEKVAQIVIDLTELSRQTPLKVEENEMDISDNVYMMF